MIEKSSCGSSRNRRHFCFGNAANPVGCVHFESGLVDSGDFGGPRRGGIFRLALVEKPARILGGGL